MKNFKILIFFVVLLMFISSAFSQQIEVALYHGQNSDIRNDLTSEHPIRKCFDKLFGYQMYQKLGKAECQLETGYDQWLLPSKVFFLRVARADDRRAKLELFQNEKSIIQTEFDPRRQKPMIIRGPLYANGQLILVLKAK